MAEAGADLQHGLELFHQGQFWEAHEAWERAWNQAAPAERFFVQALVHCAAAWRHASLGNSTGAVLQARRAMRKLAGYLPEHAGLDTQALIEQLELWVEAWQRGAAAGRATISVRR
jgi:predicted metal-dependent hydrolase